MSSYRKLSGAAAAGSRDSYATAPSNNPTASAAGSSSNGAAATASAGAGGSGAGSGASAGAGGNNFGSVKMYSSHLAIQSDAIKYRGKYKELKRKVRQIEGENDRLHLKTLRIKRNIQRMRLERAILYERLEAELGYNADLTTDSGQAFIAPANGDAGSPNNESMSTRHAQNHHQQQPRSTSARSGRMQRSPSPVAAAAAVDSTVGDVSERSRRNLDYSPSPEEECMTSTKTWSDTTNGKQAAGNDAPATVAKSEHPPARSSMKITLKRSHNTSNSNKD